VYLQIRPMLVLILLVSGVCVVFNARQVSATEASQETAEQSAVETQTSSAKPFPPGAGLDATTIAPGSDSERGRRIFDSADARASGFGDLEVQLRMILRTAKGKETSRALRIRQLEIPEDGDRVLVVFDTPANVRGTALLSHGHPQTTDDQWLFLPALQRVKKIASRNKSGPFLGSEFSFEDLAPQEVEKYTYTYLRDDQVDGAPVFVVERVAKDQFSGYAKEEVWLDQAHLRVLRVDYFDRRGRTLKTLEVSGYRLFETRFWKPGRMLMRNLLNGKSTELLWSEYTFDLGFTAERDFSVASLRRAR